MIVVVGLPFWLLIALLVKLDSRGPVIYSDTRVGLGEREFPMRKFRTMVAGAAGSRPSSRPRTRRAARCSRSATTRASPGRPRSPPLLARRGAERDQRPPRRDVARRAAAAAGARPRAPRAVAPPALERAAGDDRPLAGRGRSDLTFDDLVRLDFYYLENWSLWLDITILVRTLPAVLSRRGAYLMLPR